MKIKVDIKRSLLSIGTILALITTAPTTLPIDSIVTEIFNLIGSIEPNETTEIDRLRKEALYELMRLLEIFDEDQCDLILQECFSPNAVDEYLLTTNEIGLLSTNIKNQVLKIVKNNLEYYDINSLNEDEYYEEIATKLYVHLKDYISENEVLRNLEHRIVGQETLQRVNTIYEKTQLVLDKVSIRNSAYLYNSSRSINISGRIQRFHYSAGNIKLYGRETEIKQLKDFCLGEDQIKSNFKWWLISGEGGTGKSRLALEFAKKMELLGWTVCYPYNNRIETLKQCSEELPNDTLFVLDYTEMDLADIGQWLPLFSAQKYCNVQIRVLLIQRYAESISDLGMSYNTSGKDFIEIHSYNNGKFLHLLTIPDDFLEEIIQDYSNFKLTSLECDLLLSNLTKIDKQKRPLFAIALTDAYLEGSVITKKEELLKHIVDKEEDYIKDKVYRIFGGNADDLYTITRNIRVMATMTGRFNLTDELKTLLPNEYKCIEEKYYLRKNNFFKINLFYEAKHKFYCDPIEPDIIGEYFVLSSMESDLYLCKNAWQKTYQMNRFVMRLYQDFFYKETLLNQYFETLFIPDGIKKISDFAFYNNEHIKYVVVSKSVVEIGYDAFSGCSKLSSIDIPGSVITIGNSAFSGCSSLTEIDIPNSVTTIGKGAFSGCSSLSKINISNSITTIGNIVFFDCSNLLTIIIPNSVISIGKRAFSGCSSLTEINIPNSVAAIGNSAFSGCSSLTEINIPNSVTAIGNSTFLGCSSLTEINIPNSVTTIGNSAFLGCSSLTEIDIPNSVTTIGDNVFSGCSSLTTINIPNSVTTIGNSAFSGCKNLSTINIPDSVTTIGKNAFRDCSNLTEITISGFISVLEDNIFWGCSSLVDITLPKQLEKIGDNAFWGCKSLKNINIPNSVCYIGGGAFRECKNLFNIVIPNSVLSMGENTFWGCCNLECVSLSTRISILKEYTFCECVKLSQISIHDSIKKIENNAFQECKSLTKITIPKSVVSLGNRAFWGCTKLEKIYMFNLNTYVGFNVFGNCYSLKNISLPNIVLPRGDLVEGKKLIESIT